MEAELVLDTDGCQHNGVLLDSASGQHHGLVVDTADGQHHGLVVETDGGQHQGLVIDSVGDTDQSLSTHADRLGDDPSRLVSEVDGGDQNTVPGVVVDNSSVHYNSQEVVVDGELVEAEVVEEEVIEDDNSVLLLDDYRCV